jgi:hypothetical protein
MGHPGVPAQRVAHEEFETNRPFPYVLITRLPRSVTTAPSAYWLCIV